MTAPFNLDAWMVERGWSSNTLGAELGVTGRQVRYWRSGAKEIPKWVVLACTALARKTPPPQRTRGKAIRA